MSMWSYAFKRICIIFSANALKYKHNHKKTKMVTKTKLDGSEASMIPFLSGELSNMLKDRGNETFSFQEFSVGRGIADIYIVNKDSKELIKRRSSRVPAITDKLQNYIVSLLAEHNGMPYQTATSILSEHNFRNIDKKLQELIEFKALSIKDGNIYVQKSLDANIIKYSVAIEAKVSDWKKGLKQAIRYKSFADKAYLAIYDSHSSSARKNIEVFKTLNIGLIGVSETGINIYYEPEANCLDPAKQLLASERVYSLIDYSQDSFVARNTLNSTSA